ncbi:hypothetical protein JCM33374_g4790 [Metschnikowia sp. JCM 33374]|nr:hypothetical protein JCM33374_g4790 [Metschnikowia sp. JCM 33374]
MSATVFCPPEALIEDYPKLVKQTSRGYSLQNTSQQQSIFSHSLPSICSVMPANSSPQVKEENSHAVNFFNNPLPYYYQSQNRRENEVSGIYHGVGTNSSGVPAQASASFLPSAMSPQNSLSGGHNLFGPVPPKAVIKKPSKVVKSDKVFTDSYGTRPEAVEAARNTGAPEPSSITTAAAIATAAATSTGSTG